MQDYGFRVLPVQFDHLQAATILDVHDAFTFKNLKVAVNLAVGAVDPATIQVGWEIFQPGTGTWVTVTSMTYEEGKTRVYDLVLDEYQTYIANSLLLMDKC